VACPVPLSFGCWRLVPASRIAHHPPSKLWRSRSMSMCTERVRASTSAVGLQTDRRLAENRRHAQGHTAGISVTGMRSIALTVNGRPCQATVEPRTTLVDLLREGFRLTGTHVGCEQGVCGACTVLLDGEPVRGCLLLAVQAHGRNVETVESLAPDAA